MTRAPVIALLVAGWLSLLVLLLLLGVVPECLGNSMVLGGFAGALFLAAGGPAGVSPATYLHTPLANGLGGAALTPLGVLPSLLG